MRKPKVVNPVEDLISIKKSLEANWKRVKEGYDRAEGWELAKLGEVIDFLDGKNKPSYDN